MLNKGYQIAVIVVLALFMVVAAWPAHHTVPTSIKNTTTTDTHDTDNEASKHILKASFLQHVPVMRLQLAAPLLYVLFTFFFSIHKPVYLSTRKVSFLPLIFKILFTRLAPTKAP